MNNQETRTPRSSPRGEYWYRSYQTQGHLELSKGRQATAEEMQEEIASECNYPQNQAASPSPQVQSSHSIMLF